MRFAKGSLLQLVAWADESRFPELVARVKQNAETLAPKSEQVLRWILRLRRYWFYTIPQVRKNPCLFFSMIILAFEQAAGREVEVNVTVSMDPQHLEKGGHCWITRNRIILYPLRGDEHDEGEMVGEKDGIRYYIRHPLREPVSGKEGLVCRT